MLRLGPILDFGALCQDLIFRQRILDGIKSLDYICKCFYVRNVLCTGKVTPSATILVNPTEQNLNETIRLLVIIEDLLNDDCGLFCYFTC